MVGSATSSVKELVLPALACDPEDPAAIAAAMVRLAANPALRADSLALGRRLLTEELGWNRAAERVLERIAQGSRVTSPPAAGRHRLAVIGALPPARTGIAPYTLRHLQDPRWETCFYEAGDALRPTEPAGVHEGNRVLPAEVFAAAALRARHDTAIFVLGNSPHHVKVLDAIMRSRGTSPRRLAYLHEAVLDGVLRVWLGSDIDRLSAAAPATAPAGWMQRALAARPELPACLRLLVEHGELDGLIVNSVACRDLVRVTLGELAADLPIDVVHLPIDRVPAAEPPRPAANDDGELVLGSFGMAGDTKRLDQLARAVGILRRRRPARLVIAGWEASAYCRRTGLDAIAGVEIVDAPTDDSLVAAMQAVHVAVQLRSPTFGESSGVVSQLLAVGTPLVVTDEGSFAELPAEAASFVSADCSPADLAATIESAAGRPITADCRTAILAARSPEAFTDRIAGILAAAPRPRRQIARPSAAALVA